MITYTYEMNPCRLEDGQYYRCDEDAPDIAVWSVYRRSSEDPLAECFRDFSTKAEALHELAELQNEEILRQEREPLIGITMPKKPKHESHAIEEVTMYRMDGQLWDSPQKAIANREDVLGKVVDRLCHEHGLSPKARLRIHGFLIEHRKELRELLDY